VVIVDIDPFAARLVLKPDPDSPPVVVATLVGQGELTH
jgi:hypothetical protein